MHEIAKKAREKRLAQIESEEEEQAKEKEKKEYEARENRRTNLNLFLTRYGYAEQETGEMELEENVFLSGSPHPHSKFIRPCVLRSYCPHCAQAREAVIQNIEDLGEGLENVQLSEEHKSGACMNEPEVNPPDNPPPESKAEALVKLLTEIMIEGSCVWDCR